MDAGKVFRAFGQAAADQGLSPGDDDALRISISLLAAMIVTRCDGDSAKLEIVIDGVTDSLTEAVTLAVARLESERATIQ